MADQLERRDFLKMVGAGSAALAFPGCLATGAGRKHKPNIIYILADDLGWGDLGCYGQERIATPNIDRLAAGGMRFTDHYAGSTVCAPSRCTLLTGLHTGHCRIRGNARLALEPGDVTVAEVLGSAGYTTALIGKWGLGEEASTGVPNRQGFDYFFGYLNQRHAHNYYPEFLFRNEERVRLENKVSKPGKYGEGVAEEKVEYSHDLFADEALRFVETNREEPFFLYLALTIPHANNEARHKGMEVPSHEPYTNEDWPDAQKGHAAMITRMDTDIGRLLDKLEALGIDKETLVLFSSDNGPHREGGADPDFFDSNGPLRGIKRDLYEGGIRVPFVARWPGVIAPGSVSGHLSAFWDVLPTLAEVAGARPPEGLDGISFFPALRGRDAEQKSHDFLYWEFHERGSKQAVRLGDWKGVRFVNDDRFELYDLKEDLSESADLTDAHAEVVAKMATILATSRTENEHWPLKKKQG